MENLDEKLNERDATIRNYLLDRVDEETARAIDEKIFLEPDFYDYVLRVEQEIIEDLIAGKLNKDDLARARRIYDLPVNREKIQFENALRKVAEDTQNKERKRSFAANNLTATERPSPKKRPGWLDWRYLIPAFSLLVVILLAIWFFIPDKRDVIEKELALLNRENNAPVGNNIQRVTLESDAVRSAVSASTMPKILISEADSIIGFRLGLIAASQEPFEAIFVDEQGNEMFSVSDLGVQSDDNGKYVFVRIPSRFFESGDFQINLQRRAADGTLTKAGSFTFRVSRA